jgi:hypothetical protein
MKKVVVTVCVATLCLAGLVDSAFAGGPAKGTKANAVSYDQAVLNGQAVLPRPVNDLLYQLLYQNPAVTLRQVITLNPVTPVNSGNNSNMAAITPISPIGSGNNSNLGDPRGKNPYAPPYTPPEGPVTIVEKPTAPSAGEEDEEEVTKDILMYAALFAATVAAAAEAAAAAAAPLAPVVIVAF